MNRHFKCQNADARTKWGGYTHNPRSGRPLPTHQGAPALPHRGSPTRALGRPACSTEPCGGGAVPVPASGVVAIAIPCLSAVIQHSLDIFFKKYWGQLTKNALFVLCPGFVKAVLWGLSCFHAYHRLGFLGWEICSTPTTPKAPIGQKWPFQRKRGRSGKTQKCVPNMI